MHLLMGNAVLKVPRGPGSVLHGNKENRAHCFSMRSLKTKVHAAHAAKGRAMTLKSSRKPGGLLSLEQINKEQTLTLSIAHC